MNGINANTGKVLSGKDHLRQSIADILTTPLGSRVRRQEYGSRIFELVDAPTNSATITDMYAAVAEALARWEPRYRLTSVQAVFPSPGHIYLDLEGIYLPDGQPMRLDGIKVK